MAARNGRAFTATADVNGDVLTISGDAVRKVRVRNIDTTNILQVQVSGIHDTDWDEISIAQEVIYESVFDTIRIITVRAKANTVVYQAGVVMS